MKRGLVLLLAFALVSVVSGEVEPEKCTRSDSWSDGCNTCFCTLDGAVACTKKLCEIRTLRVTEQGSANEDNSEECNNPGESFERDCNKCYCTDQKKLACSHDLCSDPEA